MRINQNISAMNTQASMVRSDNAISKSLERLSSGLRINRAADDAAGLAISEKMRGQIRGLKQAARNAQDGISLIQTAEGALNETHAIVQRMRELAVEAANDTLTDDDRKEIQKEINQLTQEVDRIAKTTEFNTKKLLRGTTDASGNYAGGTLTLTMHIGANKGQTMTVTIGNMDTGTLKIGLTSGGSVVGAGTDAYKGLDVSTQSGANKAIETYDKALSTISSERAKLGAYQNRLEHTISNLDTARENLSASESRIRDVDMAEQMANFSRAQILMQASTAMMAQANAKPQAVLQLLS
ncbi:MAG TPA: flagellin [Bacillota bacterium]|nr:flagellin [Bacillota bacterium]